MKTTLVWALAMVFVCYLLLDPNVRLRYVLSPSNACRSSYLSETKMLETVDRADRGDINAKGMLYWHYAHCDRDVDKIIHFYKRYEFLRNPDDDLVGYSQFWITAIAIWGEHNNIGSLDASAALEPLAPHDRNARVLLYGLYNGAVPSQAYIRFKDIPKSLYYSKLDGCDTNKEYSYASYLHTLFHNYPDNKEYIKVAYAMLLFTKFNAKNFYNYSNFETLEQNMTSRLDSKEVSYVIRNYQDIIAKECEGILADHRLIPTEAKLNRYAFPLKSDDQSATKR